MVVIQGVSSLHSLTPYNHPDSLEHNHIPRTASASIVYLHRDESCSSIVPIDNLYLHILLGCVYEQKPMALYACMGLIILVSLVLEHHAQSTCTFWVIM
jgi:hypothetical protein